MALFLALATTNTYAQDIKPIGDNIYMQALSCKALTVELRTAGLHSQDLDPLEIKCMQTKVPLEFKCSFFGTDKKVYATKTYGGGIVGGDAILTGEGDNMSLNLTSQVYE